jgi:two-component system sensor histidine kinase DesK
VQLGAHPALVSPRVPSPAVLAAYVVALGTVTVSVLFLSPLYGETTKPHPETARILFGVACSVPVIAAYSRMQWLALMRRASLRHRLVLAVMVPICFALAIVLGPVWANTLAAPGGLFGVLLRPRLAVIATVATTVVVTVFGLITGWPLITVLFLAGYLPVASFSGAVSVWFCHVVEELRRARAELARAAVGEERLRFARDLHDVLGHSLQAVALRAELAERMIDRDPGEAGDGPPAGRWKKQVAKELVEIQSIARGAVKDVREVVRGYRATSLRTELDGMTAVLHAAGIRCETPVIPPDLPAHVHETFGWVARESVTNVLRHSTATWCLLTVWADDGRVHLEIVNDGVGRLLGGVPGSGLAGLTERIENVGGEFTAGQVGDGTFRIAAEVPIKVST